MREMLCIFLNAARHLKKTATVKRVATSGPYKYIRHPIYAAMYIITTGIGLMFFVWFWFIVMILFLPLWYLEVRQEEKELVLRFGNEYLDYKKTTGMFLPLLLK